MLRGVTCRGKITKTETLKLNKTCGYYRSSVLQRAGHGFPISRAALIHRKSFLVGGSDDVLGSGGTQDQTFLYNLGHGVDEVFTISIPITRARTKANILTKTTGLPPQFTILITIHDWTTRSYLSRKRHFFWQRSIQKRCTLKIN